MPRQDAAPGRLQALLNRALTDVEAEGLRDTEGNPHPLLAFVVAAYTAGTDSRRLNLEWQRGTEYRRG
jgi:hypothetical protein